jgi:TatD DNase family protein
MIDSHCHLHYDFYDDNRDEIVEEARNCGVHTMITIGADVASSEEAVDLASRYDCLWATVGIHPHDASTCDDSALGRIRELAGKPRVLGIGEIGLDYYRNLSPKPAQRKAFEAQLSLAVDLKLPIVIHTRESLDDTVEIVRDYASHLVGGVFHCFPGTPDDAFKVIEFGFVISVGGVITYKNASMAVTAQHTPLDKILLETDSPYLTPAPFRGERNRPAHIQLVAEKLAELQKRTVEDVDEITDRTCRKVFRLAEVFEG